MTHSPSCHLDLDHLPHSARGVVLIEALVALLIVALGVVALGGLQGQFARSGDLARQRGDALRLASADLETLRTYSSLDAPTDSYAAIQPGQRLTGASPAGFNTDYQLTREVSDGGILKAVRVTVSWTDRAGGQQEARLDTFISGTDPALGFAISQPPARAAGSIASRNSGIPPGAQDLGDGRSAYKPPGLSTVALVFDNLSGAITAKCIVPMSENTSDLVAGDLSSCATIQNGYLLGGAIFFSMNQPPDSEHPSSPALPLGLALYLTSPRHPLSPSYECYSDAPAVASAVQTRVLYICIVDPNSDTPPIWSGYLDLTGLSFAGTQAVKVCRYSANYDGDKDSQGQDIISNAEHPEQYLAVTGPLRNQNFLVIRGTESSPAGHAVDPGKGYFTNTATVLHQDATQPSHAPPKP